MITKLDKNQFIDFLNRINITSEIDSNYLYQIYDNAIDGINEINDADFMFHVNGINQFELINYCIGEYLYSIQLLNEEQKTKFINDENNITTIASVVVDKYLSLSMFNYQQTKLTNKYLPPVSTLNLYLNFMLNIINNITKNDPGVTLVRDLLQKSISLSRCILTLLVDGYVTEAFATWRTLHECECTLVLLEKYGDPLINLYLKHMQYGIAYKNGYQDKEQLDNIFVQIKSEMASHSLKSKDMKKFIEYGWLYGVKEFNELENAKLNFKDGLEVASGLTNYGDSYNLSSEIVHATPILIYSNKDYFYHVTLFSIYEAFFRLERSFVQLISSRVNEENRKRYLDMRNVYYSHLVTIYQREKALFQASKIKN